MTDYSNQNITGLNLSNQNLTGANFTNANATNVNFTNAIITNAIFKNTLITGATLTGITFSNVQKGHLLLRAANQTNTAVNNLTALTPAEFLIIQPAVSTDTIARISTVTVKIPNSQGEGFIVSVTPVISQLVCIFVATNQNILITTGATQIRTIRSNGTVVQDVSNGNTTLNYLKIDSISYRLTVGNGDGVIAMIPVDLNVYQVNGSGLGDIVSLNLGSASTTLNMNNNGITNVSSIQGWNVKEITAGTGVGVTATNGSYAISNTAVVRDVGAGTGISVSTTNGVATITNSAVVRDVGAGTGISVSTTGGVATITNTAVVRDVGAGTGITVSTTGGVATITNSAVVRDITAGTGISVSTTNGVATITNTGPTQAAVTQTIRDENQALVEIGALPRKPDYWATNWSIADNTARNHFDMYVSVDGKIIASASPVNASTGSIRYSTDYGATFGNGNVSLNWQTICGTSQGSRLYAISSTFGTPSSTTLYQSTDQGVIWTQITSPGFASDVYIHRMRCSGDGTYLTATDLNTNYNGRYYTSSNSGTTWTARTLSTSPGETHSLCFSRSGAIQYITWRNAANTDSKIFRSFDYGVSFSEVQGHISGELWKRIECDATGRFVYATRYLNVNTQTSQAYRSDSYGAPGTWVPANINSIEDIWVSGTGQFMVGVSVPNTALSNNRYLVYSSEYGRNIQILSLGNTTLFRTINGSADGSVLVLGSGNISEGSPSYSGDGFIRVARQGQQNIHDLSVVGGTITKSGGVYILTTNQWIATNIIDFALSSSGNTLTLPNSVDLQTFDMEILFEAYLALSGTANTLFTISFNGYYSGRCTWTNQVHGNGEFATSGSYPQSWTNPVFGYVPNQASVGASNNQYISSTMRVSKNPYASATLSPIIIRFQTAVGANFITSDSAFQDQQGHIQVNYANSGNTQIISSITIGQYGSGTFRNSASGIPARMVIHIRRKAA